MGHLLYNKSSVPEIAEKVKRE